MAILPTILGFLIAQAIIYWSVPYVFANYPLFVEWITNPENWSGLSLYIVGLCSGILVVPVLSYSLDYLVRSREVDVRSDDASKLNGKAGGRVYGLEHGILNLIVPPNSMWMNMGYWENGNSDDFPAACQELLNQVLQVSGFLKSKDSSTRNFTSPKIKLIDLGFGCGDQTLYLAKLGKYVPESLPVSSSTVTTPLFKEYIGITLEGKQFSLAAHRIRQLNDPRVKVFCADAAKPQKWTDELRISTATEPSEATETWLLALDTLYHFSPSREAIFQQAHNTLNAHIAAFDLLLPAQSLTFFQNMLLSIVALGSSTPRGNFLTTTQYTAQLVSAGYAAEDITIHDISDHVFHGLAAFLEKQDGRLREMGLGGIGRFHVAKWVFGWWARTGIVRGCIVVAKRKS